MAYKYFNQNNYANVKYPSPANPNATIKSGGCGVCCISMIVENMTGRSFAPPAAAQFAEICGARVSGGTDMKQLAKAICRQFDLTLETSSDEAVLKKRVAAGCMAIANVGGDRSGYKGVFSDSGHYVVVAGVSGGEAVVLDPGYYAGKYNRSGRSGKVRVSGNLCYTSFAVLNSDTANRSPNYYIFSRKVSVESSALAADGKAYKTGGSGKKYILNPTSGNIMVDGRLVKPGDPNYEATRKAMNADCGTKY